MHPKYHKRLTTFNEVCDKREQHQFNEILKGHDRRLGMEAAFLQGFQLADILKYMGLEKYPHDSSSYGVTLWANVKSKEDIEAFSKIVWSFGFKHSNTSDLSGSMPIVYKKGDFVLTINYYFTEDATCRMVKVGTEEVDVFERQCDGDNDDTVDFTDLVVDDEPPEPPKPPEDGKDGKDGKDGDIPF